MGNYTKQDIIQLVEEKDVQFIRLQFTDVSGNLKNVAITASQLERALDNKCMFDGSAIEGFVRIEESDMYLYPDLNTFEILPWRPQHGKVARFMCNVCWLSIVIGMKKEEFTLRSDIKSISHLCRSF